MKKDKLYRVNFTYDNPLKHEDYKSSISKMVRLMKKEYRDSGAKELVVVGIGTDLVLLDCFGVYTSELLKDKIKKVDKERFFVYGGFGKKNMVHGMNVGKFSEYLKEKHPNAFVIGVDACVTSRYDEIGIVSLHKSPIKPGAGTGKELPPIGDISLISILADNNDAMFVYNNNKTRMCDVSCHSEFASKILSKLVKDIIRDDKKMLKAQELKKLSK